MTNTTPPLPLGTALAVAVKHLADQVDQLLATRIICTACAYTAHKTGGPNTAVPLNLANVIADGNGFCWNHLQFAASANVPVQTAGGIILPGAPA